MAAVVLVSCHRPDPPPFLASTAAPDEATLDLRAGEDGAVASLSFRSERRAGRFHTGCWETQESGFCADGIPTLPRRTMGLPRGTWVVVSGDAMDVGAELLRPTGRGPPRPVADLDLQDGRAPVEVPPGTYILDVSGWWDRNDASFSFGVEVV